MANFGLDAFGAPPFWHNGPAPGRLYNFPNVGYDNYKISQRSQTPITTTTSIVAIAFDKGVMIAGDTLGSYGSLARYRNCSRVMKVNNNIILGAGGDYADFQYVKDFIEQKILDEECLDDGFKLKPKALYCWLTRIMYNRRSKFDPFWNNFVIGGLQDGVPYLGAVDKLGTAYEDKVICTGLGANIGTPILREAVESNPNITEEEARKLIHKVMEVLFYRDARTFSKFELAVLNKDGITIEGPLEVNQDWSIA